VPGTVCVCVCVCVCELCVCGWGGAGAQSLSLSLSLSLYIYIYIYIRAWGLGPVCTGENLVKEYTGGRCDEVEAYTAYTEEEGLEMEGGGGGPRSCDTLGHIAPIPS
jgi:hypothetical protein